MKKILALLLAAAMCLSLVACNSQKNELEAYLTGKTFYSLSRTHDTKQESPYISREGKDCPGGEYHITRYQEFLLTFNEDGTVDCVDYRSALIETDFTEEQRKYSDRQDSFADDIETRKYDSYSIKQENNFFYIYLFRGSVHDWTLKVEVTNEDTVRLVSESKNCTFEETTSIDSLPTRDFNELDD